MPQMKDKKIEGALTMKLEARIDARHFAVIASYFDRKGLRARNQSQFVRDFLKTCAEQVFATDRNEVEEMMLNDTAAARAYLINIGLLGVRSGDRSTHYATVKQYELEDQSTMLDSIAKTKGLTPTYDDRAAEIERMAKGEDINLLENKTGVCLVCSGSIDPSKFDNDPVMIKYWERSNKQACFECLKKQVEL